MRSFKIKFQSSVFLWLRLSRVFYSTRESGKSMFFLFLFSLCLQKKEKKKNDANSDGDEATVKELMKCVYTKTPFCMKGKKIVTLD